MAFLKVKLMFVYKSSLFWGSQNWPAWLLCFHQKVKLPWSLKGRNSQWSNDFQFHSKQRLPLKSQQLIRRWVTDSYCWNPQFPKDDHDQPLGHKEFPVLDFPVRYPKESLVIALRLWMWVREGCVSRSGGREGHGYMPFFPQRHSTLLRNTGTTSIWKREVRLEPKPVTPFGLSTCVSVS